MAIEEWDEEPLSIASYLFKLSQKDSEINFIDVVAVSLLETLCIYSSK